MHATYLASKEKTCIDCHKGIAHRLPFVPPGQAPTDTPGQIVPKPEARAGHSGMLASSDGAR
jgi:cytochrome c-type protein NapC